ncbi:GNAT family N-acetyltransferase [Liquorilactobacillus uvarum]|uniref:GNAT family N-acetyltransferase n=2 Tax=Liquorilactobacillus uvarum TaxID=303240 RepID=UPI00288A61D3|nr:N-acetyltransferase family protein [Liquorilactobacillus uvarum]
MPKMKNSQIVFRQVQREDIPQLLEIYTPYVKKTAITFEYQVPTTEDFAQRITEISLKYPFIIAARDHEILGYAYLSSFHPRAAYAWSAEISIYLKSNSRRNGLGRRFYTLLEKAAKQQHILNLNACIGVSPKPDPHLPPDSVIFHEHMGFKQTAHFHNCGYKFSTWYDMIWMEKQIGQHKSSVDPVIPFPKLKTNLLNEFQAEK